MRIKSWLKSVVNANHIRPSRAKRRLIQKSIGAVDYQTLEDRRLLAVDMGAVGASVDVGDYYLVDGEQVSLFRNTEELTIRFKDGTFSQRPYQFLNDSFYESYTRLDEVTFTITTKNGDAAQTMGEIGSLNHVDWAAPVFTRLSSR